MRLHDLVVSGNCYKVRLLCGLMTIPIEIQPVDFMKGAHKTPAFLALNPHGQVPVLEDGGLILRDSQAILIYLARKFGGETWLPTDPEGLARVMQWMSTAANDVARGPNDARLHDKFGYKLDVEAARAKAHKLLALFEDHLATRDWLELNRPTIADVACYPYISLAPEGGVTLDAYPAVRAWMSRIRQLPGYLPMPGQYVGS
jgi:glutathione S-transferase